MGGGAFVNLLRGQGVRDRVILVVCECIWNVLVVLLALPTFDDTGSLGDLLPIWIHPGDCLRFPCRE